VALVGTGHSRSQTRTASLRSVQAQRLGRVRDRLAQELLILLQDQALERAMDRAIEAQP